MNIKFGPVLVMLVFVVQTVLAQELPPSTSGPDETRSPLSKESDVYSQASDAHIREANEVLESCTSHPASIINYDCKCFASEFLSKRKEVGDELDRSVIKDFIRNSCRNVDGKKTAHEYEKCMAMPADVGMGDGVTQKDYCECFSREFEKLYKNFKGNISSSIVQREIGFSASMQCKNRSMYN